MHWVESVKQLKQVNQVFDREIFKHNHPASFHWRIYRSRAKRNNVEFTLNRVQVTDFVTDYCFYCGAAPNPVNGMDRVDNSKGYIDGNVVTACKMCNISKNDHSLQFFEDWSKRLGDRVNQYGFC